MFLLFLQGGQLPVKTNLLGREVIRFCFELSLFFNELLLFYYNGCISFLLSFE